MTFTVENLQDDIRDALGLDSDDEDGSTTKINRLINRSWKEIQNNFPLRAKDDIHSITTVDGTHEYALADDHDSFVRVTVRNPTSLEETTLERIEVDEFAERYNTDEDHRAIPTAYTPREGNLWLTPVPDEEYEVTVYYKSVLPDISASVDQRLYDIILYGASWRGFFNGGDHNRAVSTKALQTSLIKDHNPPEAKDEQDSRMAGVEVIIEENY
jgi:hypothetical protein